MNQTELNVLFIEDREEDVELAVLELGRDGFNICWRRVENESGLRSILNLWRPDIILSDHSMPAFNGLAALEITRELVPDIPFIFVSGTIGEEKAIESIHLGATDYVLKDNLRRLSTSMSRALNDFYSRKKTIELEKERSRLAAILEATTDFVVIVNPDESIQYINSGARRLLNIEEGISQLTIRDLHASWLWNFRDNTVPQALHEEGIWQGDSTLLARDGTEIPVSEVVISHKTDEGNSEYFSFIARDIRDRRAYEEKIQYLANYDSLTNLPNRSLLADRTAQAITYYHRTNRSVAILIVNISRFKLVNDGYGQKTGDNLLIQFGEKLSNAVRDSDTVARLSADSFAVLATDFTEAEDVINVVRKIQEEAQGAFAIDGHTLSINTNIGISIYPRDGKDFTTLLQNADIAMHRSKERRSEGGFQFYAQEMTRSASDRVRIENELRLALSHNELELYYQPQISLVDEKIIGVEALMRWNHPQRGQISPMTFIPIAENCGLIHQMGIWALETACKQLKTWDSMKKTDLRVAVNVSALQFRVENFPDIVAHALKISELEPHRLELELTESVLIEDHNKALKTLNQLNDLGVIITLDDFGTGYSNLSYLSRLPIHCLKIDKSFVKRSLIDNSDTEIVRAIISLSESLGLRVIAEGIETEEQLTLLRQYQCDEGQGFLFAKPLSVNHIPDLLSMAGIRA